MMLSEFVNGTKTSQVYLRAEFGYRIVMTNSSITVTYDAYTKTEDEAEQLAEDWVYCDTI